MPILTKLSRAAAILVLAFVALAALTGCATTSDGGLLASSSEVVAQLARESGEQVEVARFSRRQPNDPLAAHWLPYIIAPSKPRTEYKLVSTDAGVALEATAESSASGMYRRMRIDPRRHPVLEWRWRVANLIPGANKRIASKEDSPARLIISFHGDPKKLDFQNRAQMRLAKAITGQELPYATLMYVWSNAEPVGTVIDNPHSDRIRMIVVASGAEGVGEWRDYRRNVLEDYRRAFGEDPWDIVAVGVMTDTDNTRQKARCLYGDITFWRGE